MNKKVSIAVGTAAAVAFTGVASASDQITINSSEQYVSGYTSFLPAFLGDCSHEPQNTGSIADVAFQTTGNCNFHGSEMPAHMANGDYWTNGVSVLPAFPTDDMGQSGYVNAAEGAFDNGLFRSDGGASYFTGLANAWTSLTDAINDPERAIGFPTGNPVADDQNVREMWVDQVVVGYVQTNLDTDGTFSNGGEGAVTLAQNFRSSVGFGDNTDVAAAETVIDQRLEQMVELSSGSNYDSTPGEPFEATRQTIQMAMGVSSGPNTTTQSDFLENSPDDAGPGGTKLGQLVAQDIEGFFFSCINCDTTYLENTGAAHAFTPRDLDAHYMEYTSDWNVVPTVVHAGQ